MKKFLAAISTALLIVVLALTMAGCDNSGKIQRAFEKAGYEVTVTKAEDNKDLQNLLDEEQKKDINSYAIISCVEKEGLIKQSALIFKFPSADTIKEVLGEDGYNKAVESGLVNGNCYLFLPLGTDVVDIFKNA